MKVLTLNFLTCAVKACKSSTASFPLHPKDAELVQDTIKLNPKLLVNILPRIDWNALITTSSEVRIPFRTRIHSLRKPYLFPIFEAVLPTQFSLLPYVVHPADYFTKKARIPSLASDAANGEELEKDEKMMKELHVLLMETQINEGKLVCGNCGFEYPVKEGVANFPTAESLGVMRVYEKGDFEISECGAWPEEGDGVWSPAIMSGPFCAYTGRPGAWLYSLHKKRLATGSSRSMLTAGDIGLSGQ